GGPRAPADPRAGGPAPLGPTRPGRVRLAVRRRPGAGDRGPLERRAADRAGRPAAGPVTEPRWPATPREGARRAGEGAVPAAVHRAKERARTTSTPCRHPTVQRKAEPSAP